MFAALGRFAVRRKRSILLVAVLVAALSAIAGAGVLGKLGYGGELESGAESVLAADAVREHIGAGGADVLLTFRADELEVSDPAYRAAVEGVLAAVPAGLVTATLTPWSSGLAVLRSGDGHAVLAAVMLSGAGETGRTHAYRELRETIGGAPAPGLTVAYSGPVAIREAVVSRAQADMFRAELLVMPAVLLLLVLLFRSVVAACLPVAIGGLSLLITVGLLRPLTEITEIAALAVNAVTVLCFAVAVDSALFVVGRFREERARLGPGEAAVVAAVATAGRTCCFSGVTIGVVTLGLTLFPTGLTRSVGIATAIAMVVGTVLSVTVLPAALALLGPWVDRFRVPWPARWSERGRGDRFWGGIGRAVVAQPVLYLVAAVAVLAVLASPFLHTTWGFPDQRALPQDDPARVATEDQRRDFAFPGLDLIQVVTRFDSAPGTPAGEAERRKASQRLRSVPGVLAAVTVASAGHHAVSYVYAGPAEAPATLQTVRDIRAAPLGGRTLVGGASAMAVDTFDLLRDRLPWVLLFVGVSTFLLLGVLLRSVLLPLKALVVNALSLAASFGALTWMFQDGHGAWLVGATPTGYIDVIQPFLLLLILVGLSMDYEFFLLARIREQYERTGDNTAAIVSGLQRSAPVFTGAALVVMLVAAVFATSEVVFVKQLCVGIFIAVAVDATLVRAVLVPATMRLLGRANWWWPQRRASASRPAPALGRTAPEH